jgi:hypothetical protein
MVILQKRLKKAIVRHAADPTRRIGVIEGLFLSHRGLATCVSRASLTRTRPLAIASGVGPIGKILGADWDE